MITYKIMEEGVPICTFLSPATILKGDLLQIRIEETYRAFTVKSRYVHITDEKTIIMLGCTSKPKIHV